MNAKYTNVGRTNASFTNDQGRIISGIVTRLISHHGLPADLKIEPFETSDEITDRENREVRTNQSKEKMIGVKFNNVMCSATSKDQFGLSSIEGRIRSGMKFNFYFQNGNKLILNSDNIDAFEKVWFPFRMKFFP